MTDPMRDLRDRLILAALPNIPFEGWTQRCLAEAARSLDLDGSLGERAFPAGPIDAVLHFIDLADRRLEQQAGEADLAKLGVSARIRWLVRQRLDNWAEHREAVRRAVSFMSLPHHAARAAQATWKTADLIWYLAGDQAVDFSYYTKRLTLAGVYSTTLLTWMSDPSEDFTVTWSFLDRRLADSARLPKLIKRASERGRAASAPITRFFRESRKKASVRNFGIGQS